MFGWDFDRPKRRRNAKALLTKRVNARVVEERLNASECREASRIACATPLVVVPREEDQWAIESGFVAVTHDLSSTGISFCHDAPMEGEYLIELRSDAGSQYFSATTRHCNPLGFGYWLIGLEAEETVELDGEQLVRIAEQIQQLRDAFGQTAFEPGQCS